MSRSQSSNWLIVGIVGLVAVLSIGFYSNLKNKPVAKQSAQNTTQLNPESINVLLKVDDKAYTISTKSDSTVLDVMKNASEQGFVYKGQDSASLGFYVDEINGVKNNNAEGKYWSYYLNGDMAQAGVSAQIVKSNDTITWKYETLK